MQRQTEAQRIRDEIEAEILDARLGPGQRIPTEAALAARFGKSRATIREALKLLEQDRLLTARQGSGRYVAPRAMIRAARPITRFESASVMGRRLGQELASEVLSRDLIPATPALADALALPEGAPLIRLERLRRAGGRALLYSINHIPAALLDGALSPDWSGSVVALLAGQGHRPVMSRAEIRACALPRTAPDLPGFAPALLVSETAFSAEGLPVLQAEDYHRGDAFSFAVERD